MVVDAGTAHVVGEGVGAALVGGGSVGVEADAKHVVHVEMVTPPRPGIGYRYVKVEDKEQLLGSLAEASVLVHEVSCAPQQEKW